MSIKTPGTIDPPHAERPQRSLIKPYLLNLSGSDSMLNGVIIERNLEQPGSEVDCTPAKSPRHVIVVHSGHSARLEWRFNGSSKTALFSDGDVCVNPAGLFVPHRWRSDAEFLLLGIDPVFINKIAAEMARHGMVELMPRLQCRDELLQQLMHSLISEFEQDIPPDHVYAESLTHTLIAHLIRRYSVAGLQRPSANGGLPPRKLLRVVEYIREHLGEALSLEAIAKVADMSPSYFMTLFKQSTGIAPHQYVLTQRIEKAKALLTQTRMPIAEIASQTGFADQSHLTRLMSRHTGLTPRTLRAD